MRELEQELEGRREVDAMFEDSDEEADEDALAHKEEERRAREIQEAAAKVADVPLQLKESAARVQNTFNQTIGATRSRVETFARSETQGLYSHVNQAVEEPNIPR